MTQKEKNAKIDTLQTLICEAFLTVNRLAREMELYDSVRDNKMILYWYAIEARYKRLAATKAKAISRMHRREAKANFLYRKNGGLD